MTTWPGGGVTLYKITAPDGSPVHGGKGRWPTPTEDGPGRWRSVRGPLVPCKHGLHLLEYGDILDWLAPGVVWEVEVEGDTLRHTDKTVARRARLVRQVAVIDKALLVAFAADCAERVLPLFEKRYPDDPRPRLAIAAARSGEAAGAAAGAAAWAAEAAGAAGRAAWAAAWAAEAAGAAGRAAWAAWAARAAGVAAERTWQADHLADLLGLS